MQKRPILTWLVALPLVFLMIIGGVGGSSPYGFAAPAAPAGAAPGSRMIVALDATPAHLDIMSATPLEIAMPAHHIYETLFAWGADFAPKPMLAESYAISPDRKTWTIRLRRGVKFHNGKEMTADDVVASIDRWRKVSSIGRGWTDVRHEKADNYTIRLSSDQPRGVILSDFASTSVALVIMPKEVADGAPANELKQYVGTGPFQFDALVPDQVVRLKAFRNYVSRSDPPDGMRGAKRAMVETLEFRIIKEPATRVAALQSGEVHIVPTVQGSDRRTLRNDPNITLTLLNPYQWWGFAFNFARPLGGNLKIRQAIQAGIDHAEIALASAGEQDLFRLDPALSVVGTFYYSDIGKELFNQKDRAKARRLLAEAGYNNEPIVIVSTKANVIQDRMATVLHKQLEEMGMRVQTDWYDGATLRQVRTQRDRWDVLPVGWGTVFDPNVYSQNWHSRSGSWGWYNNREMDLAMDSAARSVDLNVRKRHYANVQRIFVNDIPMLKVFDLFSLRAARRSVQNVSPFKDLVVWNATVTR